MSFLSLTDYRSKEPLFIDPSTVTVLKQVPETTDEPRHTRVEWASGRFFMVKEEAKEIMFRLNPNPTEKSEIQKEDWEVIVQCLRDQIQFLDKDRKKAVRAYFRFLKFLRSARLLDSTRLFTILHAPNDQT